MRSHAFCLLATLGYATSIQLPTSPHRSGAIVMKGRAQGGGPTIAKKSQRRRKAEVRTELVRLKRKVYQEARVKPRPAELGLQRQHDRYEALVAAGAARWPVFARVCPQAEMEEARSERDGGEWLEVGAVAFERGVEAAAAAWLHKRLVLEHACRLYPKLIPHADQLELGLAAPVGEDEEAKPEVVLRVEVPAAEKRAGFGGLPDEARSGHYFAESEQVGNEGKKVIQDSRGLAATKAATAMSFSKSLGLRSG